MTFTRTVSVGAACLALAASTAPAFAGSEIFHGITTGIPLGAPLPEGVYDLILPSYGSRNSTPVQDVWAGVPSWLVWSTPWTLAGGHVVLDAASPMADVNLRDTLHRSGFANPVLDAQLKWALGGGFFGGVQAGVYLPVSDQLSMLGIARNFASFQGVGALSYLADGWNLSATLLYGTGKTGAANAAAGSYGAQWMNIDLTATHKFGHAEFGLVAYGSYDLDTPIPGYARQSLFALGPLIGYDFGPVNVQLKLTRDVLQVNYGGLETRVWTNLIIPIWTPTPAPSASVVAAKY